MFKLSKQKPKNCTFSSFRGVDFDGHTVGLAKLNAMCTSNSGAVNEVDMFTNLRNV